MVDITPEQLVNMMLGFITGIGEGQSELDEALHDEARKHRVLFEQRASAWREVVGKSREEREAYVDEVVAEVREQFDLAVARSKTAMEKVRNVRQQLSALQSAANAIKEDAQFSRMGPDA